MGEGEEVGDILGDLGCRDVPGELDPVNWDVLGSQTSLRPSVSPQ